MKDFTDRLTPGMRTIKTAISIIICILIYYLGQRMGIADNSDTFLACISAVICMRDSIEKSVKTGRDRLFGTAIGAGLGLLYSLINLTHQYIIVDSLLIGIGIILLIVLCNVLKLEDSVVIGCMVFLVIVMQVPESGILEHAIRRFIDTAVGIVVSVGVNHFILKPK